jgi:regulator of ribonuclease activity A
MPDLFTADLCDPHRDHPLAGALALRVLPPLWRDYGARRRFHGPVRTVRCFEHNALVKAAVESPGWLDMPGGRVGCVLVVDGGGSPHRALLGGHLAAAAAAHGWAGVLIHGAVRDTHELAQTPLGIRALNSTPLPCPRAGGAGSVQDVPVCLHGVWIQHGDWLVADEDGMVVLDHAPQNP